MGCMRRLCWRSSCCPHASSASLPKAAAEPKCGLSASHLVRMLSSTLPIPSAAAEAGLAFVQQHSHTAPQQQSPGSDAILHAGSPRPHHSAALHLHGVRDAARTKMRSRQRTRCLQLLLRQTWDAGTPDQAAARRPGGHSCTASCMHADINAVHFRNKRSATHKRLGLCHNVVSFGLGKEVVEHKGTRPPRHRLHPVFSQPEWCTSVADLSRCAFRLRTEARLR